MLLYALAEMVILLIVICVLLMLHIRKRKQLAHELEAKIVALRKTAKQFKAASLDALERVAELEAVEPRSYLDYLDEQIDETRRFHQSLNPDRDIVLDIAPGSPLERQAASLRHAYLIAEKEGVYAGEDGDSWDILQIKLQQIADFLAMPAADTVADAGLSDDSEALQNLRDDLDEAGARIRNLERFRTLFFDMESKWQEAKTQADSYYQQLLAASASIEGGEEFAALLDNYANAYEDLGKVILVGAQDLAEDSGDRRGPLAPVIEKRVYTVSGADDIARLKKMAVDQHKLINELKNKLVNAVSPEDQQRVLAELQAKLDQLQRFLQEAETCSELLENELSHAMQENASLRSELDELSKSPTASSLNEDDAEFQAMVEEVNRENRSMIGAIAELEAQNAMLKQQLSGQSGGAAAAVDSSDEVLFLKEKLDELQSEHRSLRAQHTQLEERYLELKMKEL